MPFWPKPSDVRLRSFSTRWGKLQLLPFRNAPLPTVGPKKAARRDGP